jgi:uncharacterized protein DUF3311
MQAARGAAPQQTNAERCAHNFRKAYTFLTDFTQPKHQAYSPQRSRTFNEINETYLPVRGVAPMLLRVLAALPFVGILLGVPFVNHVEPLVLGMPFVLAWIVMWVVLSSIIMAIIYRLDPSNRQLAVEGEEVRS